MYRDNTKTIKIGNRCIGGGNPILIQSMTNTKTEDIDATVAQILRLEEAGCDIIRSTVPTLEAAKRSVKLKNRSISRWWQIFISTISLRSLRLRTVRIRSVLILAI